MLSTGFHRFLRDESGGYTIWSLIWFSLYVAMGGLAVDVTDAYRNQTMLQSTADVSALAAVMSLPDQNDALAQALAYAIDNMNPSINGNVLKDAEVIFGNWDFATRTFTPGTTAPDAVRVITRRDDANNNPLATNFLRILGLWGLPMDRWNISVEAIATRYIPDCLRDGLIARGVVAISSNNNFVNEICIHGQDHVKVQNGNFWQPGVEVSMPYLGDMPQMETRIGLAKNEGLAQALWEGDLDPKMVDLVPGIVDTLLGPALDDVDVETNIIPDYITYPSVGYPEVVTVPLSSFDIASLAIPALVDSDGNEIHGPGKIYHVTCSPNKNFDIPGDLILRDMVIISDCKINVGGDTLLTDVTLASTGGNGKVSNANISFSSGVSLGRHDGCAPGGGVRLFTTQSIHSAAKMTMNGVQMVAMGDIHISAQADGANGIVAQAGGDIKVTSNNTYGLCGGDADSIFTAWYYRLVR